MSTKSAQKFDWFRLWHDMPTDPKFRVIARKSGAALAEVIAVFVLMMSNASSAKDRGVLQSWNDEDAAAALDIDPETVTKIREAMQCRVLDGDALSGWENRQPKRERDEDPGASTERVREFRERQRQPESANETPCNTNETPCNTARAEAEAEQIIQPGPPTPQLAEMLAARPDLALATEDRFARAEKRYRSRGQSVNSPEKLRITIFRELAAKTPPPNPGGMPRPAVRVKASEIDAWLVDQEREAEAARAAEAAAPRTECFLKPNPKKTELLEVAA